MNTQSQNRNDPAIDPDTPDNAMGHKPTPGQQQNPTPRDESAQENDYAPDFEPEEHKSPDKTSEHRDTGRKDGDIDTDGG